jgi:hypothetical protein
MHSREAKKAHLAGKPLNITGSTENGYNCASLYKGTQKTDSGLYSSKESSTSRLQRVFRGPVWEHSAKEHQEAKVQWQDGVQNASLDARPLRTSWIFFHCQVLVMLKHESWTDREATLEQALLEWQVVIGLHRSP